MKTIKMLNSLLQKPPFLKNIDKLLVFVACIILNYNALAQYDNLDLSFESINGKNTPWNTGPFESIQYTYIDTIDFVEGKQSFLILDHTAILKKPYANFVGSLFQYLELPAQTNKIELSVFSKSKYVDDAWIKLYGLDLSGKLISRDSVSLVSPSGWSNFHISISKTTARQLYVELFFHAKHTSSDKEKIFPSLKVDNIRIMINGKDISSFQKPEFISSVIDSIQICNHFKLDMNRLENIDTIKDFRKHRILAFGETVHTSLEIQQFIINTTKVLVEKNNCRLLMIEIPFEIGLRLNDYIQGRTNENIDELLYFYTKDPHEFIPFLKWLRDYNSIRSIKVSIMGINTSHILYELDNHLYRLVENHVTKSGLFAPFAELLEKRKYEAAYTMINDFSETLKTEFGNRQFSELKHALELRNGLLNPAHDISDIYRDYTMCQNAKWAIDHCLKSDEQAVIYTHLGHANKYNTIVGRYGTVSMGNYLQKIYGTDYFVTAVTVGEGTIADPAKMKSDSGNLLQKNRQGSLEELCMLSPDHFFYKNLKDVGTTYFIRAVGNQITNDDFSPFNHVDRVDGIVFIRESTHYRKPDDWPTNMEDYFRLMFKKKAQREKEKAVVPVKQ